MELVKKVFTTQKTQKILIAIILCIVGCFVGSELISSEAVASSVVFICAMGSCVACNSFAQAVQALREEDPDLQ